MCWCRSFVIPIARAAGSLKRIDPESSEEVILYRTMLDLIKPKLVYLDLPLFMALLSDLFPGVELSAVDGGLLRAAIEQDLRESGLQVCRVLVTVTSAGQGQATDSDVALKRIQWFGYAGHQRGGNACSHFNQMFLIPVAYCFL